MLKRILITLVMPVVLQGAVTVRGWDSTSKEVVIRYTAPDAVTACTIYGSEMNSFPPSAYTPIADLDTSLVANANLDTSRNALLTGTTYRTVVIGKMTARKVLTGYLESLALPTASTIYFKIDCGGANVTPVFATYTRAVPFGLTYSEPHPQHPDHPGQYGMPSRKWNVAGQRTIDPEYGTVIINPLAAGDLGPMVKTYTFSDASGSGWTNPQNVLANDANSATIASSTNPMSLFWGYTTNPLGSLNMTGSESSSYDYLQLRLTGLGSAATAADRTVEVALFVDGGVNPYTPWHDVVLGTSSGTVSYPASPVSGDHWQAAGDKPIPRQFFVQRKGKVQYVASTKVLTITAGDKVGENWTVGTPVTIYQPPSFVCDVTSGSPIQVTTCSTNSIQTGDVVTLTNIPGNFSPAVGGKYVVTRVDTTHFTLNGTTATGTFGQVWHANSSSNGTTPGNPPILYIANSYWSDDGNGRGFKFANFVDTGWTALNGTVQSMVPHNFDSEHWEVTGQNIPNTFSGTGDIIPLGVKVNNTLLRATAQVTSGYPIESITDSTHVVLSSGPVADITSDADYSVDSFVVKVRKKTNTADTITIQYADFVIRSSRGTSGGAAGGPICSSKETTGPGGKKGNFCRMPGPTWVASDGSESHYIGDIPMITEQMGRGQGKVCWSSVDSGNTASFGVNELHPERIYCSYFSYTGSNSPQGYDQTILRVDYEGDYSPRSSSEGTDSLYPGYAGYPFLPNCYGYGNYNDGTHPRVITTGNCVSFYQVVPSIQSLIQNFGQKLWNKVAPNVTDLCLTSPSTTASWNPATQSVWMSAMVKFACTSDDNLGVMYVFDLKDEAHQSSQATIVGEFASWERPNLRWTAIHGGYGLKTSTWMSGTPTVIGWGAGNHTQFEDPTKFKLTGAGPYWFSYNAVNGVAGANIGTSMSACPAGNPYIPNSPYHLPVGATPDGSTTYFSRPAYGVTSKTTGCITVTIDGEPCDVSPSTMETTTLNQNATLHQTKCGKSGALWIDDIKPGDYIAHQDTTRTDPRGWEVFIVLAKTGTGPGATLTLYRGGVIGWTSRNVYGNIAGAQDHTTHPHRFMTVLTSTPEEGFFDDPWIDFSAVPVNGRVERAPSFGHGGATSTFEVGSNGDYYGVSTGTVAQRIYKTTADWNVMSSGLTFNGKGAKDSLNIDSHLTIVEQTFATMKDPFVIDGRPWQGNATVTWTKVPGTVHVYKYPSSTFFAEKFLPSVVRNGVWILKNVSGPSCTVNDSTLYVFGLVHVAGECVAGSQPGELYASAPVVDTTTTVYQASGADLTATRDLAAETSTAIVSRYTQTVIRPDLTGRMTRAVSSLNECYRCEDSFKNWSIISNGRLMVGRSKALEFTKSDMATALSPPIVLDTVDRTKWVYTPVVVPPVAGADNVLVRFGYEHYGDPTAAKFYCTYRAENCVMAVGTTSANPYYFETTDTYSGITYAQPLTVQVPAIGNRVLHWQIVYRNAANVVITTKYGVSVVP